MNGTNKWLVLIVTVFGTFMSILDATITNIAIPKLQAVFGADVHQIQWVISGYTLALGVSIPISGWAADRFGIKKVYIAALAVFTLGSALCGVAWNESALIAFRVLQGLGGGPLLPLSLALIFSTFPPRQRGLANGLFGIPVLFAPALGPTLGGFIVQNLTWQLIFYINVPIGILGVVLATIWLSDYVARPDARFDLPGFLLAGVGSVLVLYALSNAAYDGWGAAHIVGSLAVGALLLLAFIPVELRSRQPLLDLRLFGNAGFTVATLVQWLTTFGLFGGAFLLPLFLQNLRGLQPFDTGLLLLWQAVPALIVTPLAGFTLDRVGPRLMLVVGMALLALTSWQIAWLFTGSSSFSAFELPLILRGVALGLTIQPAFNAALGSIHPRDLPRASALSSVTRQIVASFTVAILVTVIQQATPQHQARLAEVARYDNPAFVAQVNRLSAVGQYGQLTPNGVVGGKLSPPAAHAEALATLYRQLVALASAEAFRDALILAAAITLPGILFALAIRRPVRAGPRPAAE